MLSRRHGLMIVFFGVLIVLAVAPRMIAQEALGEGCPTLVKQALEQVGDNCTAMDRNNACYGFNRVNATFAEAQAENFFTTPSDRSALTVLQSIETLPLNAPDNVWGIAVMNVQANVPSSLPGQAVVFMLLGDVQVENAVDPTEAFTPAEPVNVTTTTSANVRSGPSTNNNVVGSVPAGTQLQADGLNADQTWARVLLDNQPVWISRDLLQPEVPGTLGALPVLSRNARTPMQAFYFRTGFEGLDCTESPPSVLVVQGPKSVTVDFTANGADIRISSTVALFTTPQGTLLLLVIDGSALVGGIQIPAGFAIEAPLSPDGRSLAGPWGGFRSMTAEEIAQLIPLENIPVELLHYPIVIPTLGQIAQMLAAMSRPQTSQADETPEPGEIEGTQEPGGEATDTPLISAEVGMIPQEGQYNLVSGNCELSGSARLSGVSPDGKTFKWGVLTMSLVQPNLYVSGGLYVLIKSPTSVQVGGFEAGACITEWEYGGG